MTMDQRMGAARREDEGWVLSFERHLAHPRAKVWRAITESGHLTHWLPCDIVGDRRAGAAVELPFWPAHVTKYAIDTPTLTGRILVWDPPAVFEWTWDTDRLRWELEETAGGTMLRFTTWLAPDADVAVGTAAGYHVCLDTLEELLDRGTATPLVDVDPAPLEAAYREALTGAR